MLVKLVKSENLHPFHNAVNALGAMGPVAKDAIPALTAGLQETDREVRIAIEEALKKIQGK